MQISQFTIPDDFIDLGVGQPESIFITFELFRQASSHALQGPREILQYGINWGMTTFA